MGFFPSQQILAKWLSTIKKYIVEADFVRLVLSYADEQGEHEGFGHWNILIIDGWILRLSFPLIQNHFLW